MASKTIIVDIKQVIHCRMGCKKKKKGGKKNISTRLGLTGMHSEIAFQIKCTNVQ